MKKISVFCAVILLCTFFTSCAKQEYTCDFFAMDTPMSITCYGGGAQEAAELCIAEINRLDALLDADGTGAVGALNRAESSHLSDELHTLLLRSLELSRLTEGAFDITLRPVSLAWGFGTGDYRIPSEEELAALAEEVGYEKLTDPPYLPDGMQIDFGAIAKGYAANQAVDILKQKGISSAVIALSGNITVVGRKDGKTPFSIGLQDPVDASALVLQIPAENTSIVTSGSYQRFFEQDGIPYHHIIDPETLSPAKSGLLSATIICEDAAYADALSTALFVMGKEKACAFYRQQKDFDMILITEDRVVYHTPGIRPFDLSGGTYSYFCIE